MTLLCESILHRLATISEEDLIITKQALVNARAIYDQAQAEIDIHEFYALLPNKIHQVLDLIWQHEQFVIEDIQYQRQQPNNKIIGMDELILGLFAAMPMDLEKLNLEIVLKIKILLDLIYIDPYQYIDNIIARVISPLTNLLTAVQSMRYEVQGFMANDLSTAIKTNLLNHDGQQVEVAYQQLKQKLLATEEGLQAKHALQLACASCLSQLETIIYQELIKTNLHSASTALVSIPISINVQQGLRLAPGYVAIAKKVADEYYQNKKLPRAYSKQCTLALLQYHEITNMAATLNQATTTPIHHQLKQFANAFIIAKPVLLMRKDSFIIRLIKNILAKLSCGYINEQYWRKSVSASLVSQVQSTFFKAQHIRPYLMTTSKIPAGQRQNITVLKKSN